MGANIMLAVHCKKADPLDIKGPVADYVAMTYGDSQAADAGEDLEGIQEQRAQIVGMGGSLATLRDLMAKCGPQCPPSSWAKIPGQTVLTLRTVIIACVLTKFEPKLPEIVKHGCYGVQVLQSAGDHGDTLSY